MKKALSLALALFLATSLAACSSNAPVAGPTAAVEIETPTEKPTEKPTQAPAKTEEPAAEEEVTEDTSEFVPLGEDETLVTNAVGENIVVPKNESTPYYWDIVGKMKHRDVAGKTVKYFSQWGEGDWVYGWVHDMELTHSTKVEIIFNDGSASFEELLVAMIMAGDPPDVFNIDGVVVPISLGVKGYLTPLQDDLLNNPLWETKKDLLNAMKVNGNVYFAPMPLYNYCFVFYNKDILDDAGLEDPADLFDRGEWTVDKMQEMILETVANVHDENITGMAASSWYFGFLMQNLLAELGTDIVSEDNGKIVLNLDDPKVSTVMNRIYDLINCGAVTYDTQKFLDGAAAFHMNGDWEAYGSILPLRDPVPGPVYMVPAPKFSKEGKHMYAAIAGSYGVPIGGNLELGMSFIDGRAAAYLVGENIDAYAGYVNPGYSSINEKRMTLEVIPQIQKASYLGALDRWAGIADAFMEKTPWSTLKTQLSPEMQKGLDEFYQSIE